MTVVYALLVLVGGGLAAYAFTARDSRRVRDLRQLLDTQYLEPEGVSQSPELRAFLARSGRAAERALGGTSLLGRVRATLDRSDYTVNPGELVAISVALGALGALVGLLVGAPFLVLLLVPLGLVLPYALVRRSVDKRRRAFEEQLPDVLDLIAAGLESGSGIGSALELVVAEADEPSAGEFARVLAATRLGQTLVEALEVMAERLDSRDLRWTVQAISVQQRTGGRLAEVLRIVAEFMRARAELRRDIRALTAEGRLSAYILGGLPFVLAGLISLSNPGYLTPLITTIPGLVLLAGAGVLMGVAFFLMSRIIKIEV